MQLACEEERACVCSLTCTVLCPGLAAIWMRAAKQRQKLLTKNSFFDAFCDESLCIITKTIYDWRRIVCGSLFQRQHLGEAGTGKRDRQCNIWSKKATVVNVFALMPGMNTYEYVFGPTNQAAGNSFSRKGPYSGAFYINRWGMCLRLCGVRTSYNSLINAERIYLYCNVNRLTNDTWACQT